MHPSGDIQIESTRNSTRLVVGNVKKSSEGEYMCSLRTEKGEELASASLHVEDCKLFLYCVKAK